MRIAWITDPHLNHCSLPVWERWIDLIELVGCDALLVTGDISEGDDVVFQLLRLADYVKRPIFFVLGNHDFYQSSIRSAREAVAQAAVESPLLRYLRDESVIELSPTCALVGEDGWGDATEGDYEHSMVRLNDFRLIDDFVAAPPSTWKAMLQSLGRDASDRLSRKLSLACANYSLVIVATHVPPFRESCWYEGRTTDDNWAPFFVCGQLGNVLRKAAVDFPKTQIEVYCGHTHHEGIATLTPNLRVTTGSAKYGEPTIAELIQID